MKRKLLSIPFLLIAGMVFFSSCREDDVFEEIEPNTDRVIVEFTNALSGESVALEYSDQWVEVDLTEIRLNTRTHIKENIEVTITPNHTVVGDYNNLYGTSYQPVSTGAYSILPATVKLGPGQRTQQLRLRIRPSLITGGDYAIGLSLATTSKGEISDDRRNIFIALKVKNEYEGNYRATGLRTLYNGADVASGVASTATIDWVKPATTINNNTIEIEIADLAGAYMYLEVNPVTNAVTVSPSLTAPTFFPMGNNGTCIYDPVTKKFTLNYLYYNAAGNLRHIQETLVAQ